MTTPVPDPQTPVTGLPLMRAMPLVYPGGGPVESSSQLADGTTVRLAIDEHGNGRLDISQAEQDISFDFPHRGEQTIDIEPVAAGSGPASRTFKWER